MIKNYLTIIRRNIVRQPLHTILNLSCLTISISGTLLILLYIDFELNYDRFHIQADRIYRIETPSAKTHEKVIDVGWSSTPANLGPYIQQDYPGIEAYVRFYQFWQDEEVKFQYEGEVIAEENVFAVDATIFEVFSFDLMSGDPQSALKGPNKIVLSESLARRIFGQQDPIGKIITTSLAHDLPDKLDIPDIGKDYSLMVTGVYHDMPKNTHLMAEAMISSETDAQLDAYYFNLFNVFTYVLLNQEVDPETLAPKLSETFRRIFQVMLPKLCLSMSAWFMILI